MNTAISETFGVSEEVVNEAAASCAKLLAKWYGSEEAAIQALTQEAADTAQIAMMGHIKQQRAMTLSAHMNQRKFAGAVLHEVKHPHQRLIDQPKENYMTPAEIAQALADWEAHQKAKQEIKARAKR
ncbi:hypothetical protein SAMN03159444_00123 [Pseudomonas sp. NFACC02]|nr:hypothetical protein SAMN03159444_00123 [Pseudomonas sp. NFACC02]